MRRSTALVRCADFYAWQHPALPRLGRFTIMARWKGSRTRADREAKRAIEVAISLGAEALTDYLLKRSGMA